ncbi:MAG TPA: GAF domain-containing sensor histidine kinase [Candidatus Solibacter sp.]|jgi:signal transduction histidine kinase|nr:GAF domain-containing sensor histidine kinase [Candidatus Solibacter sp.]
MIRGGDGSIVPGTDRRSALLLPGAALIAAIGIGIVVATEWLSLTTPGGSPSQNGGLGFLVIMIPFLALAGVGFLLSTRLPKNPVGWLVSCSLLAFGLLLLGTTYTSRYSSAHDLPGWPMTPLVVLATIGWSTGFPLLFILLPLVFPDGHLVSRRWRVAVWLAVSTILVTVVSTMLAGNTTGSNLTGWDLVFGLLAGPISGVVMLALIVSAVVSLVLRYRRADSDRRHQLKWFVGAIAIAGVAAIPEFAGNSSFVSGLGLVVGLTVVPMAIAVAVLRYRLYDIDVIISRALVYATLAALITAIYVGIVVGIGNVVGSGGKPNLALSIVATAVVAVGFQPARERLQRLANRLIYGLRATPYEVLAAFSERVAETYAGEEVLPRMARVLQEGTGAESATVWLRSARQLAPAATHPEALNGYQPITMPDGQLPNIDGTSRAVPVRHQDELLGALTVTKRHGESLTPIEEKLLGDLAHQAGLVLKNVGLTADLQARLTELRASRQRLVAAQDQERRRLERNLHDGAQQNLVALKVKLGLVEMTSAKNPQKAKEMLTSLKDDADEALETLRDLARGIYPPLLADQGLSSALEAQARKATLPVTVEGVGVGRYPQDTEAAVYFCILEALQNVQKYAGASSAAVRIFEVDHRLTFEVSDDGQGFDAARTQRGAGLTNMEDRLDALGGDLTITSEPGRFTQVSGSLPI